LAGTIYALGKGVSGWQLGERVTVPFVAGCGTCPECRSGNQQVCERQFQPGFTAWGSFAEYVAIDFAANNLVRLPDELDFATAASLGCRFATSFRAVVDHGRVSAGEWVAVHGCGGVGLSAIMIASALGANVVAIDVKTEALALARTLGATATVDASAGTDVVGAVREVTGGGAHLSIDALGHPVTAFNSIMNLRRRGRHVQVGLLLAEHSRPALPMDRVVGWELEIRGSHGMQAHRYPAMMEMMRVGKLQPQKLLGKRIALDDAPAALMRMGTSGDPGISVITSF
jgi:alcohol dehydrogenase